MSDFYYRQLAAAYVRGSLEELPAALAEPPLEELDEGQLDELIALAGQRGLRIHRFKRTMDLPRVRKVLGVLHGLLPERLLDVGSGRGAFLWPLLDTFPDLRVTAVDALDYRVADIQAVHRGGIERLEGLLGDLCRLPFGDGDFPCATALEVLEHLPDPLAGLRELTRVTERLLILSVPSQADDNPEHLHLLDGRQLRDWLGQLGWSRVRLESVPNHLVLVASREASGRADGTAQNGS